VRTWKDKVRLVLHESAQIIIERSTYTCTPDKGTRLLQNMNLRKN